jgi:hypothetical protein
MPVRLPASGAAMQYRQFQLFNTKDRPMRSIRLLLAAATLAFLTALPADAAPRSSTGTGSKSSSSRVGGYTKRGGTQVAAARRTTPDGNKKNNYSTKGNMNPHTGKKGTK